MKSMLVEKGEEIYQRNRDRWEKNYMGKIVAIEVEKGSLAGIGDTLDEACENACKKHPGKKFYFRKVGPCAATSYLYLLF